MEKGGDYFAANLSIKKKKNSFQLKQPIKESWNQISQPIFRFYLMLESGHDINQNFIAKRKLQFPLRCSLKT